MKETLKDILNRGPKFEENILKAFENRKLIFFVGAGVSRIMGIRGWSDFSTFLIKKAFPTYREYNAILRDIPDSKERITIAYKKFESEGDLESFYKYFAQGMKPDEETFKSKENIYKILNRFDAIFLTTNADNLFEEVLGGALCHEDYDLSIIKSEHQRKQNHLFYLHGHYTEDMDINENNLVFTAPQYAKRYNDPRFVNFLQGIFSEDNVIIFIGYGLNEFELIDYIVTKSGYTPNAPKKAYILYGFCENEDVLYEAKKSYFDALNIELIPYDIGKKGYDSLITVLNLLNEDYKKKTIIPVTETISDCINNYNEQNHATILRILKDENLSHTKEPQIVREIQQLGTYTWTKLLYDDGLFSSSQLDKKIIYRAWPLLELFVDWVKSDETLAQKAAIYFLGHITEQQIDSLSQNYTFINKFIIQIILSLKKESIKLKHIDLMNSITEKNNLFYHELIEISTLDRIVKWDLKFIRKLFNNIVGKIDIESYDNTHSYVLEQFFKKLNPLIVNQKLANFIFGYFVKLIKKSEKKPYTLFMHVHDVDNIYKNHQKYWKIFLDEIKYSFSKLNTKAQRTLLEKLLTDSSITLRKLGLYLARKSEHNISELLVNKILFSNYSYFHECYLVLKYHTEKKFLNASIKNSLCTIINNAHFGIDEYDKTNQEDYFNDLILSKRLLLLKLLSNKCSKTLINNILFNNKNLEPYPSTLIADECDYVHSATWVNETIITQETFKDIASKNWCEKLIEICSNISDDLSLSDCGRQFAQILLKQGKEDLDTILSTLSVLPTQLINSILYEFHTNKDKFASTTVLLNTCLDILNAQSECNTESTETAKAIFFLLSDIDMQDETIVRKILTSVKPWLNISIDKGKTISGEQHILTNLINRGDFYKISVLLNCYITLKKLKGYTLDKDDIKQFIKLLENENQNKTYTYALCYNYQNLKYISPNDSAKIFKHIFSKEPFDMTALLFCVLNSKYLFPELINIISEKYLSGLYIIPNECKDGILPHQLYSYIISSRYYNRLSVEEFEKAYKDSPFIEYFLRSISIWAEKENFILDEWIIPCWNYIKNNFNGEKLQEYAELLLNSVDDVIVPTEPLLDLYIEVSTYCSKRSSIYVSIPKILVFFNINTSKSCCLLKSILKIDGYISVDDLKLIMKKYKEFNQRREAHILLNMLSEKGEISNATKEELAKLLD